MRSACKQHPQSKYKAVELTLPYITFYQQKFEIGVPMAEMIIKRLYLHHTVHGTVYIRGLYVQCLDTEA